MNIKRMKRLTIIVILAVIAFSANAHKYGYIIYIDSKNPVDSRLFKTQCTETLQESIFLNTGLKLDVEKIFEADNLFFEYRENGLSYYVEKRVVKQKKNGKLVYRKITKKERKNLATN